MDEEWPKTLTRKTIEFNGGNNKMDNGSFALGLGIGVILGAALGISIVIVLKSQPATANVIKEETEGVMYNYDDHNRLQSIIPVGKRLS